MKSKDKEERDKSDARNNLEELVYAIRDRLYAQYEGFVQENEKSNLSKQCDEIEDWLYGDGEDQPKSKFFFVNSLKDNIYFKPRQSED